MKSHIPNLDMIRAIAILMVLLYHTVQWLPEKPDFLTQFSEIGKYGVNLFFALSGFLIGSLYFSERETYQRVDSIRFILRRITRTMPPYFIVLIPAFLGSYFFEGEKFNSAYLVFFQNYLEAIPYFMVSWSLCVEEHFYALLPFALAALYFLSKFTNRLTLAVIVTAILLFSWAARCIEFYASAPFGYHQTGTHFYLDALGFGVLVSWFHVFKSSQLKVITRAMPFWIFLALGSLFLTSFTGKYWAFCHGTLLIAVFSSLVILSMSYSKQYSLSSHPLTRLIANSSYAIYLTHAITIHVVMIGKDKLSPFFRIPTPILWVTLLSMTILVGIMFYFFIEKPMMKTRNIYLPSKNPKK